MGKEYRKYKKNESIKVVYDYQAYLMQNYGGVSRYIYEVSSRMHQFAKVKIFAVGSHNYYYTKVDFPYKLNKYFRKILTVLNKALVGLYCWLNPDAIIHSTFYDPYILKLKNKKVITIHDMIHEKVMYNEQFAIEEAKRKKECIYGADRLIAISNKTKDDILSLYPDIPEDKITVIYHGNSLKKNDSINFIRPHFEYFLFVGNRDGYKNFKTLLASYNRILADNHDIKLVCIGGGSFNEDEIDFIRKNSLQDDIIHIRASDDELYYYYHYAKAFIFPSLYEGFGIPILEAFYAETPVILNDNPCFREIAQDCAAFFKDEKDLYSQMCRILKDYTYRDLLIRNGKCREKEFNWDRTAALTSEVYNFEG